MVVVVVACVCAQAMFMWVGRFSSHRQRHARHICRCTARLDTDTNGTEKRDREESQTGMLVHTHLESSLEATAVVRFFL